MRCGDYFSMNIWNNNGLKAGISVDVVVMAIHLNALYNLVTVGLQPAVEVVKVPDSGNLAGSSVEQLCGNGLA